MRRTLMLNLDEAHASQLDELSRHFRLSADDTVRLAVRLAHAGYKQKADVMLPELKPRPSYQKKQNPDDFSPC
jgi:hypothetical protein